MECVRNTATACSFNQKPIHNYFRFGAVGGLLTHDVPFFAVRKAYLQRALETHPDKARHNRRTKNATGGEPGFKVDADRACAVDQEQVNETQAGERFREVNTQT